MFIGGCSIQNIHFGGQEGRLRSRLFLQEIAQLITIFGGTNGTNLLLLPQREQSHSGYFHNFETYTWNVTLGLPSATETRNKNLVVLIHKVQTTIVLKDGEVSFHNNQGPDSLVQRP